MSNNTDNKATANSQNTNPNSSCPICPNGKCLCEIELNDKNSKINYWAVSQAQLKDKNNLKMPKHLINLAISSGAAKFSLDTKEQNVGGSNTREENKQKKGLDFSYTVTGECEHSHDKCVQAYMTDFSDLVPEHVSTDNEAYSEYTLKIDQKVLQENSDFKPLSGSISANYNPDENKQVLISFDDQGEISYFKRHKPSEAPDLMRFIRGFNFLLFGKIDYLPANVYRFGVMTCDGEGQKVATEHFTDFFVLPKYEVKFEGELPIAFLTGSAEAEAKIEYTETIDGKMSQKVSFTKTKFYEFESPEEKDKRENAFWYRLCNLFRFLDNVNKFFNADSKLDYVKSSVNASASSSKLFKGSFFSPVIKFAAEAKLESKEGKPHINRERSNPPKADEEENVISPNGLFNTPNNAADESIRESTIQKELSESKSYLQLDPFIGGAIAVNIIKVLEHCPYVGVLVKGVNNLLEFDIFNDISGTDLKFDSKDGRKNIMQSKKEATVSAKGYCFLSTDISCSPIIHFHNNFCDELGGALEIRGSFGLGLALGAMLEVDIVIYSASYQEQGSYGMRFYFSLDYATGVVTFWHDGFTSETKKEISQGIDASALTKKGDSAYGGAYGTNGNTVSASTKGTVSYANEIRDVETVSLEWVESAYNPNSDMPYDNPHITVETANDGGIWGSGIWTKGTQFQRFPNPVSRYHDPSDGSIDAMNKQLEVYDEATRKRVLEQYNRQIDDHRSQKSRAESGYWLAPTSKAQPAWTYTLGEEINNEAKK